MVGDSYRQSYLPGGRRRGCEVAGVEHEGDDEKSLLLDMNMRNKRRSG
jgi:hypothetical protein